MLNICQLIKELELIAKREGHYSLIYEGSILKGVILHEEMIDKYTIIDGQISFHLKHL